MTEFLASNNNETALISIGERKIVAAARSTHTMSDQHTDIYISEDSGKTWFNKGPVTLAMQHPAHILMLQDGTLLNLWNKEQALLRSRCKIK